MKANFGDTHSALRCVLWENREYYILKKRILRPLSNTHVIRFTKKKKIKKTSLSNYWTISKKNKKTKKQKNLVFAKF